MNNNNFIKIIGLIIIIIISIKTYGHKQWVHQYLTKEGYKYFNNSYLNYKCGKSGDIGTFSTLFWDVVEGSWNEDRDDPVWDYDGGTCLTPSVTHFWQADFGENSLNNERLYGVTLNIYKNIDCKDVPNAWTKARKYLFGCTVEIKMDNILEPEYSKSADGLILSYTSLVDLYKNGNCKITGYIDGNDRHEYGYTIEKTSYIYSKKIALEILGRVAHLLQDMSVPAHAHNHLHPCAFPTYYPEYYEQWLANAWTANDLVPNILYWSCDNDPDGTYNVEHWSAGSNGKQNIGEFVNYNYSDQHWLYNLFMTLNQTADFFPSGVNSILDVANGAASNSCCECLQDKITGNTTIDRSLLCPQFDNYLTNLYSSMNNTPPTIIKVDQIGDVCIPKAIEMTAELFYWFAHRTGEIPYDIVHDYKNFDQKLGILIKLDPPKIQTYHAINTITAQNSTVKKDYNITYNAGKTITLKSGFKVEKGGKFYGSVEKCTPPAGSVNTNNVNFNNNKNTTAEKNNNIKPVDEFAELYKVEEKQQAPKNITKPIIPTSLSIYPNPSNGSFNVAITASDEQKADVYVMDYMSREVLTIKNTTSKNINLNIQTKPTGVYFVKIIRGDKVFTHKIVYQ